LFENDKGILSNDMMRKMLVLHRRFDTTRGQFKRECNKARSIYQELIETHSNSGFNHLWAVELLYLFLLSEASLDNFIYSRKFTQPHQERLEKLLNTEVASIVKLLLSYIDDIEIVILNMETAMVKDLELKFLVNNYLRGNQSGFSDFLSSFKKKFIIDDQGDVNGF
jgi:hypothetical protein